MKATEILSEEHQHILKVIDAIEDECRELEAGKDLDKEFFLEAIDFIRNYADKFHHAKEEDILFEELNSGDACMHCNPTQQMLYEHDQGRHFVKCVEEGVKENNRQKVIETAWRYAHLLREHIMKEDEILYPMADEALSEDAKAKMLERFSVAESKRFGKGTKDKYLAMAERMKGRKRK